jgi:hypothetical protein
MKITLIVEDRGQVRKSEKDIPEPEGGMTAAKRVITTAQAIGECGAEVIQTYDAELRRSGV